MSHQCWVDPTMYMYLASTLVSLYGSGLFAWWWFKIKRVSYVYSYVTILLSGECLSSALSLWARHLSFISMEQHEVFVDSPFWIFRKFVGLIAMSLIAVHMTYRVIHNHDIGQKEK